MVTVFVALFAGYPVVFLHRLLLYGSHHGYSVCCSVCRLSRGVPPPVVAIREITMVTVFVALFAGSPLAFLHQLLLYGKSSWLQCLLCLQVIPWHSFTGCCYTGSYHGYSVCCSAGYPLAFLHQLLLYRKSPWLQCLLLCLQVTLWRSSTSCCYTKSHHDYSVCCSVCRLSPGIPPPVVAIREITMVTAFVALFAGYPLAFLHQLLLYGKSPWLQCLLFCLQVTLWCSSTGCCYMGNHHGYIACCSVCRLHSAGMSLALDRWPVATRFGLRATYFWILLTRTGHLHSKPNL